MTRAFTRQRDGILAKVHRAKGGTVIVHSGTYVMLPTDKCAIIRGKGAEALVSVAGQEVFAAAHRAVAVANVEGTRAYATTAGSVAMAIGNGTTAIAMHFDAKAFCRASGARAIATVKGARAYIETGDYVRTNGAEVIEDPIQKVFPNKSYTLRQTIR